MDMLQALFANSFLVFGVVLFVAVVLLLEGIYLTWNAYRGPEAKRIEQRLRALSAAGAADTQESLLLKKRMLSGVPAIERLLQALPRLQQLDRLLVQSGLDWTVASLLGLSLLFGGLALAAAWFMHLPWFAYPILALGTAALPTLYVVHRRHKRMLRIEQQLPDALDLISRALRAGHAFPAGLLMVGEEMADPIAGEFRTTHEEVNFGMSLQQALIGLAARVPSTDLRYFVVAVLIQRETGGNLTEVLGNLSKLIRERLKLLGKVRVLTAEGRLSAWILSLLPFALTGIINLINPKFMAVLWSDPLGLKLIGAALAMMALGIFWMRRIIKIHV